MEQSKLQVGVAVALHLLLLLRASPARCGQNE
jgi:hypothetical protein